MARFHLSRVKGGDNSAAHDRTRKEHAETVPPSHGARFADQQF